MHVDLGCRTEISTSLGRPRSSFELVRWHTWRSCDLIGCVLAVSSFRKSCVVGLQSIDMSKYVALSCLYRHMAVASLHAGDFDVVKCKKSTNTDQFVTQFCVVSFCVYCVTVASSHRTCAAVYCLRHFNHIEYFILSYLIAKCVDVIGSKSCRVNTLNQTILLVVCVDMHCFCGKLVQLPSFERTGCDLIIGEGSCLSNVPSFSSR